jgi:hypothetical protein
LTDPGYARILGDCFRGVGLEAKGVEMSGWKELLTWSFEGERFEDHGLDLRDLKELGYLRDALSETAKTLWKADHLERDRVPRGFEEGLRLKIFSIQAGSASLPVCFWSTDELVDGEPQAYLEEAALSVANTVDAANGGERLPDRFPRHLLPKVQAFGSSLAGTERVSITISGRKATVTKV